ncbi:zf-HC2 domain-containing protein [Planococcus sp. CP5-4]|uniref:zf-HC2 domain-containing protein n=1 Tax=unclassified Planococcus (in: firmicutes) TaxID=2662419 RepID=UPI001C22267E|nr:MULTISPECIES: zf-HC2 domain-containing protein [unclassified Planococcus (in: firmicutes)]MBU9675182.1 zf-HC2 domain-containing protein [Planococcus sp. CP5-4_YE]MBV0910694.1 zf-HC2 domain-containing protein [Planococcus sp. CP5-4_UN]MBW6062095.1 zf-HC2 domain-containing protein [Planococcus sp. CP5-4]
MRNECYIVRDLLPSYIDQLCSEQSRMFIEKHIAQCESCAQILQHMKNEFDDTEDVEITVRLEQKKPFEKVSQLIKAQGKFSNILGFSFWSGIVITVILLVFSFNHLVLWQNDQEEVQRVAQEQQDIMDKVFAVLMEPETPNEQSLQIVFQQYKEQLQHIAVFPSRAVEDTILDLQTPSTIYPIDYERASIVVGKFGEITEPIVPVDYDIGTMAMANEEWVVQFEYKDSYLATVENAHQIKHFAPSSWELFLMPIIFSVISFFIFLIWVYHKRIMRPMEA